MQICNICRLNIIVDMACMLVANQLQTSELIVFREKKMKIIRQKTKIKIQTAQWKVIQAIVFSPPIRLVSQSQCIYPKHRIVMAIDHLEAIKCRSVAHSKTIGPAN